MPWMMFSLPILIFQTPMMTVDQTCCHLVNMFRLVDNPDEIVFACPNTSHVSSIDDMTSDPDPSGDTPASMGDVMLQFNQTSLTTQICWTAPFLLFPLFPSSKPMYDTICWSACCTILSRVHYICLSVRYYLVFAPWYDINLRATATTILSIGGVTIPIYLVSRPRTLLGRA